MEVRNDISSDGTRRPNKASVGPFVPRHHQRCVMKTDDRLHASMDVSHKKILSPRHCRRTWIKDTAALRRCELLGKLDILSHLRDRQSRHFTNLRFYTRKKSFTFPLMFAEWGIRNFSATRHKILSSNYRDRSYCQSLTDGVETIYTYIHSLPQILSVWHRQLIGRWRRHSHGLTYKTLAMLHRSC